MNDGGGDAQPNDIDLADMVTFRIAQLNAKLNAQSLRVLKSMSGLTLVQWRVLVFLDAKGSMPPSEIARFTEVDKGQLSRVLKVMMSIGLIQSEGRRGANRSHLVLMTEKGRAVFSNAHPAMQCRQKRLMGSLSQAERNMLFQALEKLSRAAREFDEVNVTPIKGTNL